MKLIVKIIAACLLIGVAVVAVLLLPAHLQVRDVNPALPSEESLRALLAVDGSPSRVSFVTTSSQHYDEGVLGHNSVLVEWPNGDMVMLDAGMDEIKAVEFADLMQTLLGAEPPQIQGGIASLLGDDIGRVKAVGFTHLHIDHTQGVLNFCEARGEGALALQTVYQRDLHNFNTEEGAAIVVDSCLQTEVFPGDGLISFERFPGLAMYPLGGHTPGSTLFAVADGERLLLFSGDITNTRAEILEDRGKGFIYSYLMVPENTARTARLREWLGGLDQRDDIDVVVSHDYEAMKRLLLPFGAGQD